MNKTTQQVDDFLGSLREIDELFGKTNGILRSIPDLPVRKGDRMIRKILGGLFHLFLLRIQRNILKDFYLKERTL